MKLPEEIRQLDQLSGGFQKAQILFAALRGEVFEYLRKPATAREVAQRLQWSERGTEMLLDGLVAVELAGKADGRYVNLPVAEACLVEGARYDQRNILRHKANTWDAWSRLDETVRTGQSEVLEGNRTGGDLRDFILGMQNIARESAQGLIETVDLSEFHHALDLGGGPATFSITFLQAHPHMRATLFDFPEVIEIAREQVNAAGLDERFDYREGDMTKDALGAGYDLILISNIIHSLGPEENQAVVKKCHAALAPGGMLIIKDFLLDDDRGGPAFSFIFALHMLVLTENGGTYSRKEVASWTSAAGFQEGRYLDLTPQSRLWMVRK